MDYEAQRLLSWPRQQFSLKETGSQRPLAGLRNVVEQQRAF